MDWLKLPSPHGKISQRQSLERDPETFLREVFDGNPPERMPTLLVGFTETMRQLTAILKQQRYKQAKTFRNCLFQTDDSNECSIELWELEK